MNGLNLLHRKTKHFTRFSEKEGLPNNVVYAALDDAQGNLWISTNRGISRFNPGSKQFTNFDISDGLQNSEFNVGAYFRSSGG
ncbi:MAG: hypothetical protein D6732_27480, partial [Methanobacteriota archaeon]